MSHVGGLSELVGAWNFVNASSDSSNATGMTGIMQFAENGSAQILLLHNPIINASWGANEKKLAECFFAACTTFTFTKIAHDHIEMIDANGNTIHLMRSCDGQDVSSQCYVNMDLRTFPMKYYPGMANMTMP
jgi:hypothetical protein